MAEQATNAGFDTTNVLLNSLKTLPLSEVVSLLGGTGLDTSKLAGSSLPALLSVLAAGGAGDYGKIVGPVANMAGQYLLPQLLGTQGNDLLDVVGGGLGSLGGGLGAFLGGEDYGKLAGSLGQYGGSVLGQILQGVNLGSSLVNGIPSLGIGLLGALIKDPMAQQMLQVASPTLSTLGSVALGQGVPTIASTLGTGISSALGIGTGAAGAGAGGAGAAGAGAAGAAIGGIPLAGVTTPIGIALMAVMGAISQHQAQSAEHHMDRRLTGAIEQNYDQSKQYLDAAYAPIQQEGLARLKYLESQGLLKTRDPEAWELSTWGKLAEEGKFSSAPNYYTRESEDYVKGALGIDPRTGLTNEETNWLTYNTKGLTSRAQPHAGIMVGPESLGSSRLFSSLGGPEAAYEELLPYMQGVTNTLQTNQAQPWELDEWGQMRYVDPTYEEQVNDPKYDLMKLPGLGYGYREAIQAGDISPLLGLKLEDWMWNSTAASNQAAYDESMIEAARWGMSTGGNPGLLDYQNKDWLENYYNTIRAEQYGYSGYSTDPIGMPEPVVNPDPNAPVDTKAWENYYFSDRLAAGGGYMMDLAQYLNTHPTALTDWVQYHPGQPLPEGVTATPQASKTPWLIETPNTEYDPALAAKAKAWQDSATPTFWDTGDGLAYGIPENPYAYNVPETIKTNIWNMPIEQQLPYLNEEQIARTIEQQLQYLFASYGTPTSETTPATTATTTADNTFYGTPGISATEIGAGTLAPDMSTKSTLTSAYTPTAYTAPSSAKATTAVPGQIQTPLSNMITDPNDQGFRWDEWDNNQFKAQGGQYY